MKCEKCGEEFIQTEVSHDIPKYLGGFDCDGRHRLCKECHNKYEREIISRCFLIFFNKTLPFFNNNKEYEKYMTFLKNSPYARKAHFIAWEVKKEWWT